MFIWTLQAISVSILFIFIVHNILQFLKSTLTVPKIKDLVNSPAQKYNDMFNILNNTNNGHNQSHSLGDIGIGNGNAHADLLPSSSKNSNTLNPYGTNINELPTSSDAVSTFESASFSNSFSTVDNNNINNNQTSMKNELKMFLKKQLNA
jgi:hypothetical protein